MKTPAIAIQGLRHTYGKSDAVHDLSIQVEPGECYGFFGRNGAGKTTTIKCLLNLLRPARGDIRVLGLNPATHETAVKSLISYVPDFIAFYPWMSVREVLDYQASFRDRWNLGIESDLLKRFGLDPKAPSTGLSKGQRTQLALIAAIAAEPELLILDEPTSGLDPLVRREFIQTVIGAYQEAAPGSRTVFVSTHLISEFEGLIDRFTIVDQGREVLTAKADEVRSKFKRVRALFEGEPPVETEFKGARSARRSGRSLELVLNGNSEQMLDRLKSMNPVSVETESLSLEEIFVATVR